MASAFGMRAERTPFGDTPSAYEPQPRQPMSASGYPAKGMLSWAFHEVKHNPPKILARTRRKFGAADAKKQAIAIALSKARRGY